MISDEIKQKLFSKKSKDRLSAAKRIAKEKYAPLADDLFTAYLRERSDPRTWEVQSEMIHALGVLHHLSALEAIEEIVQENQPHDMITIRAATAFVRLKRISVNDAQPILQLLKTGRISVIHGALEALALERMLPPDKEIQEIIESSRNIHKHMDRIGHEYGLVDPRIYVAAACAGWDSALTRCFLEHCIETAYDIDSFGKPAQNIHLIDACEKALKGKYKSL